MCASFKFGTERNLCKDTWPIPSPCNHVITIPIDMPQKEFLTNGLGSMLQRVNVIYVTREPRVKNNLPRNKLNVHFIHTSKIVFCYHLPIFSKSPICRPHLWYPKRKRRTDFPTLRSFERCPPIQQLSNLPKYDEKKKEKYFKNAIVVTRAVQWKSTCRVKRESYILYFNLIV